MSNRKGGILGNTAIVPNSVYQMSGRVGKMLRNTANVANGV